MGTDRATENVSGIPVRPLYGPDDWAAYGQADPLGFPGQPDYTRGIYATMHRGRTWTQRQLIGLGTPADYNERLLGIMARGATAVSLIPCNSVYRGYDMDSVEPELLGTCGVVVNNADHMDRCLDGVDLNRISCALNDPSPFTLLAFMLVTAERRGVDWKNVTGTSNQSDYLSHYVANHMFYRLSLPGARRVLMDHIAFCNEKVPRWNPMSVVGQHMQQAGATPAEAMAFTLATAVQNAEDCIARGMDPDQFLPRFTFFFDISLSFFEEIAKFRAGRRIWARLARERLGAKKPAAWRFKFHAQTSGVDLTRQQPLNNIARVAVQAMAGIFGGLQSLHTDAYDEAFQVPSEAGGAHRRRDPEHPARGSAPHRRDRSARRLVLRRVADRCDGGEDPRHHEDDRRRRRHVQGGRVGPGAAHDRRLGAALPAQGRQRRADDRRRQRLPRRRRRGHAAGGRAARPGEDAGAPRRLRRLEGEPLARRRWTPRSTT